MPQKHQLKIHPENFRQLVAGERTFELRLNDRGFEPGDTVELQEFNPVTQEYSGLTVERRVNRVFTDLIGVQPGYVALTYSAMAVNR